MEQTILYIIVAIIAFEFGLGRFLDSLNKKNWSNHLPDKLKGIYDEKKYRKSQNYYFAKGKLSDASGLLGFAVILGMLLMGGFAIVDSWVASITTHTFYTTLLFFCHYRYRFYNYEPSI